MRSIYLRTMIEVLRHLPVCSILATILVAGPAVRAAEDAAAPSVPLNTTIKVVCFGDSITEGMCATDPKTKSYPAVLQTLLDDKHGKGTFNVVNAGISGQDTRQGLKRLDALLAKEKPDWVLMEYGTNDMWTGRKISPADTRANLTEMLQRMKAAHAKVLMATLPPVWGQDREIAERNQVIKEVAANQGAHLIDLNASMEKAIVEAGGRTDRNAWAKLYFDENGFLHPNDVGYAFLAGQWLRALDAAVAKESGSVK